VLDVHRLRLLRELHHRGTLAAVAQALDYSPSTISHQLDVLEREAGVALLEPIGRRVRLTAEALLLVRHADAVLERLERAEAELAAARGKAVGTLRLATFQTVAHSLVLDLLEQLDGDDLQLDITHLEAQRALPAVLAGDFDMVLAEEFPGVPLRLISGLEVDEVCRDPLLLALPDGWISGDETAELPELSSLPWVFETDASPAQDWAYRVCRSAGFEPRVRYRSDDVLLHVRLVEAGRAAAFLPALVRRCGFPDLRLRSLPGPAQGRRIFTAVRAGSSGHPAVRRVRAGLREVARLGAPHASGAPAADRVSFGSA
jgi:DNA-binding transcriptional LysR family regulator